jgi:hypothetical protein
VRGGGGGTVVSPGGGLMGAGVVEPDVKVRVLICQRWRKTPVTRGGQGGGDVARWRSGGGTAEPSDGRRAVDGAGGVGHRRMESPLIYLSIVCACVVDGPTAHT